MSSGIELFTDEAINDYVFWTLDTGLWDGRVVSPEEASGFFTEIKSRIEASLFSQDPDSFDFKKVAVPLAWIGSQPKERLGLLNEIEELRTLLDGTVVPAKRKHKNKKKSEKENPFNPERLKRVHHQKILETREVLIAAGFAQPEVKCKVAEPSFWQKYGRQMIVAAAIVAIVVTLIAVSVSTAGTASGMTAAAAGAAINSLQPSLDKSKKPPQSNPPSVSSPPPLALEPVAIATQTNDLTKFPSCPENGDFLFFPYSKLNSIPSVQPSLTPSQTNDIRQPPMTNFPWINESISYLEWRERQLQKELLTSLINKEQTVQIPQTALKEPAHITPHPVTQQISMEPKLPIETQEAPVNSGKVNYIRQFVDLIEKKLGETADPNYIANLKSKDPRPNYGQQFVSRIEEALKETASPDYLAIIDDPNYLATKQVIDMLFPKREMLNTTINNYASSLSSQKPAAPIQEIPLLGHPEQSTVHFHCGISNNFSSIAESGLCLKHSLDSKFAVQPHLIHSNSIVSGLTFVGLEKVDATNKEIASSGINLTPNLFELARVVLGNSQIERSIDYEVKSLSQIAQNIIKIGNPNLKQLHVTFSNGGYVFHEALKRLPPEYQETIIVITTGTTSIIDEKLAHKVYNVIGDKDWPSLKVNGDTAIAQATEQGVLEIIPQNETLDGIGGHYSVQPDYQDKIFDITENKIIVKYELY